VRSYHTIFFDVNDPSTYAASVLLNDYYKVRDLDWSYKSDWRYLFIAKRIWLRHQKKDGKWVCHYCGKELFKLPKRNRNRQSIKGCVTIDHKVAASKVDDITDSSNFLECCHECNRDKGSMSYEKFINKPRFKK
jgi:hypothetical protein